jgi:hypothetical protein
MRIKKPRTFDPVAQECDRNEILQQSTHNSLKKKKSKLENSTKTPGRWLLLEQGKTQAPNGNLMRDRRADRAGTEILIRTLHETEQPKIRPVLSEAHETEPTSSETYCRTEEKS